MFTCCPECKTCFRITDEQLAMAKGLVRCGHCHQIFNGSENLTKTLSDEKLTSPTSDNRHEADEHDSSIFAAEFSRPEDTSPAHAQIENKDTRPFSSGDHFDLPSFSARDDFIDTFVQDETAVSSRPRDTAEERVHSLAGSSADTHDDLFEAMTADPFSQNKQTLNDTADQIQAEDAYEYSDISDALKEEQNIEDIFSDMHQQLELGMAELEKNEPETDKLATRNKDQGSQQGQNIPDDELEINQAIDNIFAESEHPRHDDKQEDQDYRVEKEMLAAFGKHIQLDSSSDNIKFEDEAISITDIPASINENRGHSSPKLPEDEIPRRLRDSLAVPEPKKSSFWKIIAGLVLILLLSLTLLIQLALFRSIDIIHYIPQAQPWLEQFCQYAPCRIHARRDIDQIRILERDIRANPEDKKALLITATIINQARFSQGYPDIRVTLSDLTGSVVAQRRFSPADYLGSLNNPFLLMKPGVPVHIHINVLDPGRDAVNFEFQFL